ncbi:MAG: tRNA pseudouridine(38-40) synthase TruA [Verrucomicrobia bacterium]|nr:tRNA pseudouridine(38-40) synthase TruA [Verrucomicrobiota bacterium]
MNIKLILTYDGTHYFGWQKTKTGPSVQESLEKALFQILRTPVLTEAASRTDRGVHARGQVVSFVLEEERDLSLLQYNLNSVLPSDIRILSLEETADSFHPTLDAVGKEYRYSICLGPVFDPFQRQYAWHVHQPLDLEAMQAAALAFIGTHDFSSFTTEDVEESTRTLFDVKIAVLPENQLEIRLYGDRFLYKMARRIVGTLVEIGQGKIPVGQVGTLFEKPNRSTAGMTAPAHGLFLHQVFYTANIFLNPLELALESVNGFRFRRF